MGKVDNNKHIVNSSDGKSGRSGLNVMLRLIGLVKPLAGYMAVAILMGLAGHLWCFFYNNIRWLCNTSMYQGMIQELTLGDDIRVS